MPFSIDALSVASESQRRAVRTDSNEPVCNRLDYGSPDEVGTLCSVEGLVEQEPIAVF